MADIELVIKIPEEMYKWVNDVNRDFDDYGTSGFIDLVKNGTPLPKGAEILTKEAYSDLCMRASKTESEGENKKEKHTCISCRFYRYDRRTWPCDDCLDYDRWKEVEE